MESPSRLPPTLATPTVLVVDDNPTTRYATSRVLQSAGYGTCEAASGQQALDMGREGVDAVVLDVHLPDMDGYEVCRRLRALPESARLPVVYLSAARLGDHDKVLGMESGADAYLTHPAEPATLLSTLETLMRSRAAEAQFLALYEQSLTCVCIVDAEGRFASVNPGLRLVLGRGEDELLGTPVADLAPEDRRARAHAFFTGTPAGRRRAEFPLVAADGRLVYFEWSFVPVAAPGRSVAIATDLTERRAAEAARRESEQQFRTLFDSMDEGFCVIEFLDGPHGPLSDYVHVMANPAYLVNAGIPDVVGQRVRDMVPDEAGAWVDIYRQVLLTGAPIRFERELEKTGRHLELAAFRVEPPERRQVAVLFQDVTQRSLAQGALRDLNDSLERRVAAEVAERLRAEEALRQSQKLEAIGQLTGGVAHDFNNVLAIIKTSIDLLRRVQLTDERRLRFMDSISNAVTRGTRLTGQLLAFARRQALQPAVFDAGANTQAVAEMLGSLTGARIHIDLALDTQDCFIHADPSQFDTALVNLAVNARDAMGGSGTLAIRVQAVLGIPGGAGQPAAAGAFVAVSIQDSGSGIAAEHLEQIFEPFFTTKGVGHGTGLGLSQVFGFARQSGGDIRVQSVLGQGSTFTLYLPRTTRPGQEAAQLASDGVLALGEGRRLLAVEDNPELAAALEQTLQELGYTALVVSSAEHALALLREGPGRFAAVFSDVVMAGMSGIELGRAIAGLPEPVPVVLTSGYSSVLAQGVDQGLTLLPKPYSLEDLARVLHEAIHHGDTVPAGSGRRASPVEVAAAEAVRAQAAAERAGHVERERLAELEAMRIMDSEAEAAYDELTRLAASFCQTPIALISLVDDQRQWFKARVGLQAQETPREHAFCAHAIEHPEQTMVVADATRDPRFASNPLVTGDPHIRFYAGAPLVTSTGQALGTLCVIDREARTLEPRQMEVLQFLAGQVVERLEARRNALGLGDGPRPAGTPGEPA